MHNLLIRYSGNNYGNCQYLYTYSDVFQKETKRERNGESKWKIDEEQMILTPEEGANRQNYRKFIRYFHSDCISMSTNKRKLTFCRLIWTTITKNPSILLLCVYVCVVCRIESKQASLTFYWCIHELTDLNQTDWRGQKPNRQNALFVYILLLPHFVGRLSIQSNWVYIYVWVCASKKNPVQRMYNNKLPVSVHFSVICFCHVFVSLVGWIKQSNINI